ncbi:hypothetical protein B0H13DRAFT_1923968 [Mycena leptocephala]|nr:hypothetical protein B0H13DRAFT_1923968 [Mycena leptocephala]
MRVSSKQRETRGVLAGDAENQRSDAAPEYAAILAGRGCTLQCAPWLVGRAPARASDPARPWVGRARARGCRAGTKGRGLEPVCSALPVRLGSRHIGVHTAARTHADESGTAARAGAGIDSGGGGVFVDLDLGRRCTGLGAVVVTGGAGVGQWSNMSS